MGGDEFRLYPQDDPQGKLASKPLFSDQLRACYRTVTEQERPLDCLNRDLSVQTALDGLAPLP